MQNFQRRFRDGIFDSLNLGEIIAQGHLTQEEQTYLRRILEAWNFYEGYHWEGIDDLDTNQVTFNFVGAFVNKFVAFEFGKGFSIKTPPELDKVPVTINDPKMEVKIDENNNGIIDPEEAKEPKEEIVVSEKTLQDFLDEVWKDNHRSELLTEIGQTKSITGEAWVKVSFEDPEDIQDPFSEYPNGRIRLNLVPTQFVYPRFDDHDRSKMVSLLVIYPIRRERETGILFRRTKEETVMYKEFWTPDHITVWENETQVDEMDNPYGFIPFVQIKNFPVAGKPRGKSDIDDIIPLNVELNMKKSDVSEVIDYHSAPITLVYGAKIGNLEKGANKVWGGLPKDSKVENLALQGDLVAAETYIKETKTSMCEIAGIPETVLGGAAAISNTSGVALEYMNLPLIERTRVKRENSQKGLEQVNKMILFLALDAGLIKKPDNISMKDFVRNIVEIPDTLPKDVLLELQQIQQEMSLGLECRHGALERLGRDNIPKRLAEIDTERSQNPEIFNPSLQQLWYSNNYGGDTQMGETNAGGMMNGQTPPEMMRKALTGQNGGSQQ